MRPLFLSTAVALIALAVCACGGSDGSGKKADAGGVVDASHDSAGSGGAANPDGGWIGGTGGATGSDGKLARDVPAPMDAPLRPDVPWSVPDLASLCHVEIAPLTPESLVNLVAGPTAFLRVQGAIAWGQTTPYPPNWTWSVIRSDGQAIAPTVAGVDPSVVQFPISMAARYDISVSIGDNCAGSARALAQDPQNDFRLYRLRVIPPSDSASSAVPYEVDLKITAGSTQTTKDVDLDTGLAVTIDPSTSPNTAPSTSPGAPVTVAVPSTIRIQSSGSTWVRYGRSTNQAPFRTVLDALLEYQVLVVPDPPTGSGRPLPPYLLNRATSDNVRIDAQFIKSSANPLPIPSGITISGHLMTPDGPATGATISLNSYLSSTSVGQTDLLFSTVGQADANGAYSLGVNPGGMLSIVVSPPSGSHLPTARIDQGINLSAFATALPDLDFQWSALPASDLELTVAYPGGLVPLDPVAIRLESATGAFASVGVLSVAGDSDGEGAWSAVCPGVVRRAGHTDASGKLTFPSLPKGPYKLTLAAPSSLPDGAVTTLMIDTSQADGSVPMTIPLASKVTVIGRLLDARGNITADTAGALVVATDISHDLIPNVVSTTASQDGIYLLVLDPRRTYRLVAQPVAGRGLPAYVPLVGFSTGDSDMQLDDQRIPSGVLVRGHVTYAGSSVPGAIVQAFCLGLPPDCVDRNNLAAGAPPAFASAISNANGDYGIYLPAPAASN